MPGPMLSSGRGQSSGGRTQLCWCPPPACQSIWEARNIPAPASLRGARAHLGLRTFPPSECHRPLGGRGSVKAAPLPLRAPRQLTLQSAEECGGRPFRLFIRTHTGSPRRQQLPQRFLVRKRMCALSPGKARCPRCPRCDSNGQSNRGPARQALPQGPPCWHLTPSGTSS